ncbi:response regulator [Clostridium sp. ZS2-4]|uniref:response regulator n=1 Tax=Clostridium sp. ZS2-4 TaxID=2987703 RepID=UPI00227D0E65|nr:response regulator [Clostridium sp. ZS2-4]MCY6355854.1 response regulator [Clostridium sp. ZS2-4]
MCTILLLEDDIKQRNNLKKMLYETNEKLKFYEAEDKDEALDICKRVAIDIFFVDISLKNSSGLDFAVEIREMTKYELSWIIFLTTHMEYITQAFKKIHCYDYVCSGILKL